MNKPITSKINSKGHMEIGGCDTVDLVKEYGTPVYVLDEVTVRGKCREYRTAFKDKYSNFLVCYASKALCASALLKIIQDEGMGVDASSGGELYTAKRAGCNLANVYFHGNNKTERELEDAVNMGIGRVVVDNYDELSLLGRVSSRLKKKIKILFRVNPGIEAHTHEFIQTGQIDSKFGIAKDEIVDAVKKTQTMEYIEFAGLHSHIGSQIFDISPFLAEADVLTALASEIYKASGVRIEDLNLGGGLGIDYSGGDNVPTIDSFVKQIIAHVEEKCDEFNLQRPKIVLEPGRSIIGNAGLTLYTIGSIKEIPGIRTYISVDGGMSDNPRPILYDAKYEAEVANKAGQPKTKKVTVAGRFCESGDKLIKDYELQNPEVSDILAVFCTGAYNYSMASNYNRVPRPAMVLVNNGLSKLIIKRESYEDLVLNDIM